MASYTLEQIMYGEKYNIESDVFVEVYKMAEQGIKAKDIREKLNMIYVKHALITAKKMQDARDTISVDNLDTRGD